ncbi:MAG: hypothetical protein H7Y43_02255 [Akkermansiaceae bacterium]|nr:hypothetical protein [Verrucomicrobiales bacterium]
MIFGASSYACAYQRVMDSREKPAPPPPAEDGASSKGRDPFGPRQDDESDDDADPFDAFFNESFSEFGPGKRPQDARANRARHHPETAASTNGASRLKELYRALVRRLHPDTQQEMTSQKSEWWHQAQAAYEAGDADQLEVILTLCEIGDHGTTAHTSASLLQRITAQLKSSLREIKRQLAGERRNPAWAFSLRTDRDAMAVQMRRSLTRELEEMREHYEHTRELIAGWKAAAERLGPSRRKRTPRVRDCPF